ncbi:MAG: division/cell wall cluster transcriptional repressor MraZ [Coriobacteriia bacterium]|nr:division/cell wall cluster transcriptional repressor MraZ [Coriobacteriia bacterium]MCL2606518.1 division/cell wall cluster transcriptional repressor MraZ [Coriobacteriia bacterium]
MAQFLGRAQHTMDAKGRVSLPAKYRPVLAASELVLVEGRDQCLWLYRNEEYQKMVAPLLEDDLDETLDDLRESFMVNAAYVEVDGAGRIRVPPELREYASLQKAVTITGKGTRMELWDSEVYEEHRKGIDKKRSIAELSERKKQQRD